MMKFRGYLKETRRPIYSAALVLPFLCIYHAGTLLLDTTHINGADALIIRILASFSVHSIFASALVLAASFAIWQCRTRASWKIRRPLLLVYFLESVCFALLLLSAFCWFGNYVGFSLAPERGTIHDFVLYCGAGVYEELLFRGFLLGLLLFAFQKLFPKSKKPAAAAAALTAAMIFSAFHYIGPSGDAFSLGSFAQRTVGGLYFGVLFIARGFGLAAAAHAVYDIIVGGLLS